MGGSSQKKSPCSLTVTGVLSNGASQTASLQEMMRSVETVMARVGPDRVVGPTVLWARPGRACIHSQSVYTLTPAFTREFLVQESNFREIFPLDTANML